MFVVSFVGNRGTFIRGYKAMIMDVEFLYHVGYIVTSVLGLFVHELFYSILVGEFRWLWHRQPGCRFRSCDTFQGLIDSAENNSLCSNLCMGSAFCLLTVSIAVSLLVLGCISPSNLLYVCFIWVSWEAT